MVKHYLDNCITILTSLKNIESNTPITVINMKINSIHDMLSEIQEELDNEKLSNNTIKPKFSLS